MDPMQNLNDATAAMNLLTQRAGTFYDDADAQIAQRQAAYDALGANLKGVVASEMHFRGHIVPGGVATNVQNGIFNSLHDFVNAAPAGAYLEARIEGGVSVDFTTGVTLWNQFLQITQWGGASRGVLNVKGHANGGTHNALHSLRMYGNCGFRAKNIDINLDGKLDAGLPWSWKKAFITAHENAGPGLMPVTINNGDITGSDQCSLVSIHAGGICALSTMNAAISGDCNMVSGQGKVINSEYVFGTSGGAALADPAAAITVI